MIDPFRDHGREMARCMCDECGAVIEFPAMHGTTTARAIPRSGAFLKPSNVAKSILARRWTIIGKQTFCTTCDAARKAPKEKPAVTNVEPIRQPTREQKRQIIEMLTACYDTKSERYTGTETDVTIADAIGGGCMFGWVAAIRDDMFGPDNGNEEHEALVADLAQWRANADKLAADMHGNLREFNESRAKVAELEKRLGAVMKALGPKAVRA